MAYQLDLKPAILKDGQKYRVIQITDIALHTAGKTPTPSIGRKIEQAHTAHKPGRIYAPLESPTTESDGTFTLELLKQDPDLMELVRAEEAKGYKVLLELPKGGIPIVLGKDTMEFLNSKNGKRVLRGLAKGKREE